MVANNNPSSLRQGSLGSSDAANSTELSLIELKQLTKQFGTGARQVTAVEDVSLSVERPEFVAIMGASGSGKSTLLHLIGGLTRPTAGEVWVSGVSVGSLKDSQLTRFRRQQVGIIFQAFNLVPTLTAADNIELPVLAGGTAGPLGVDAALELVGMSGRRSHRPDELSGGEQQRVAIARALMTNPPILLADEPTGNLDSENSRRICELLRNLQREHNRTVVVVTHEPEVAMWSDRVLVLKDGGIVTDFRTTDFSTAQELAGHYHELLHSAAPVSAG
ncbi:MAG: ABC transporter ATP-binding protein [Planctomycetaceae bacterium]